jgi:LDH2 family malate/lactate/ureidoglycolate dehydrogenase
VARLSGYIRLWEKDRLKAKPVMRVVHETPSTAVLDADLALGLVAGPKAMHIAMDKARQVGTGWVAVKNSNHYGIAAFHAMMALEEDMIGISMTNASALVSPTFSKSRFLGTNPIAVAIPANEEPPFVMDMATTTVANGKLEVLQREGEDAPLGWAQDKDGFPTTDAFALKNGGAMLPLGGDRAHGSHKGYCLGAMVDIFSAVLSGANYGPWVPPFVAFLEPSANPVGDGIGHFFGAMRIDAFRPADEFKDHMDRWIRTFRQAETVYPEDKVLIPGDPERELAAERKQNGIPVQKAVIEDLKGLASKFNLTFKPKQYA